MTATELKKWLNSAPFGEWIVYHTGLLMHDRGDCRVGDVPPSIRTLREVADTAWKMYEAGQVMLVQRDAGMEGKWPLHDYIAIKLRPA